MLSKKNIYLWINYIEIENFEIFICFPELFSDNEIDVGKIKDILLHQLTNSKTNFNIWFEKFPEKKLGWIKNPFFINIKINWILDKV